MKEDDRLKFYETEELKTLLKTQCSQNLGTRVVQTANCILERIKRWQTYNSGRAFHWTMPSGKKKYLYKFLGVAITGHTMVGLDVL